MTNQRSTHLTVEVPVVDYVPTPDPYIEAHEAYVLTREDLTATCDCLPRLELEDGLDNG